MSSDPTRQRDQPALTTSTGRSWLILGGLLAAISIAVLGALRDTEPRGLAVAAAIVIAVLYAFMVIVRLAVPAGRRRLALLAAAMLAIAAVGLVAVVMLAWGAAGAA